MRNILTKTSQLRCHSFAHHNVYAIKVLPRNLPFPKYLLKNKVVHAGESDFGWKTPKTKIDSCHTSKVNVAKLKMFIARWRLLNSQLIAIEIYSKQTNFPKGIRFLSFTLSLSLSLLFKKRTQRFSQYIKFWQLKYIWRTIDKDSGKLYGCKRKAYTVKKNPLYGYNFKQCVTGTFLSRSFGKQSLEPRRSTEKRWKNENKWGTSIDRKRRTPNLPIRFEYANITYTYTYIEMKLYPLSVEKDKLHFESYSAVILLRFLIQQFFTLFLSSAIKRLCFFSLCTVQCSFSQEVQVEV